jgi:hypothetical protein
VTRRLCTIAGFYKYAVEEELLEHSPAAHVRRPRVDYESHATALDRNELGALLVAAGLGWLDALTRAAEGSPWIPETGQTSRAGTQMPPARATSQQDWASCGGQSALRVQGARTGPRVRRLRLR